jgi:hypothetical protein
MTTRVWIVNSFCAFMVIVTLSLLAIVATTIAVRTAPVTPVWEHQCFSVWSGYMRSADTLLTALEPSQAAAAKITASDSNVCVFFPTSPHR